VLARAVAGEYGAEEVDSIPAEVMARSMDRLPDDGGAPRWGVKPHLKERVVFRRLNLATRPYPMSGPLDAIFCRNVMIYFDQKMRAAVVGEFERLVRPGGLLVVGHSETLNGIATRFRSERPSVYRMPEAAR